MESGYTSSVLSLLNGIESLCSSGSTARVLVIEYINYFAFLEFSGPYVFFEQRIGVSHSPISGGGEV